MSAIPQTAKITKDARDAGDAGGAKEPKNVKEWRWLAFDTSTDVLSLAVARGPKVWTQTLPGGAQASSGLIPAVLAMLAEADMPLASLDAIVFGRGPGSFTGLRTACAVAQGLAFGADIPVLPVDTLLAVAEEARFAQAQSRKLGPQEHHQTQDPNQGQGQGQGQSQNQDADLSPIRYDDAAPLTVLALLDARMDEVYSAAYRWQPIASPRAGDVLNGAPNDSRDDAPVDPSADVFMAASLDAANDQVSETQGHWQTVGALQVGAPERVKLPEHAELPAGGSAQEQEPKKEQEQEQQKEKQPAQGPASATVLLAGNAFAAYGDRLPAGPRCQALPTATALLRLAPALWAQGLAVPAEQAMPLYIRDKVANTTAEREAMKAQAAAQVSAAQEASAHPAAQASAHPAAHVSAQASVAATPEATPQVASQVAPQAAAQTEAKA